MRKAVIDSSALIGLVHLEVARKLSQYFDTVYVPRQVQTEVSKKSRFRYRLRKLFDTGVFVRCDAADKLRVQILLDELDEGEAEALVQAQEKNARFFIGDESRARQIAANMYLTPVGTVRILFRLHHEGLADEPISLVRRLQRELHFRIAAEVVEEAIAKAAEPIIELPGV